MLDSKALNKIIFLDLETVPQAKSFFDLTPKMQELFQWRFKKEYAELGLGRKEHYIQEASSFAAQVMHNNSTGKATLAPIDVDKIATENMQADDMAKMESLYQNKASLFAEFGKIVCCSIGWFEIPDSDLATLKPDQELQFKTMSFYGDDEKQLLLKFQHKTGKIINAPFNHSHHFAAHNGKVFDFPFLGKRFILNGLPLPKMFDIGDKKPWDLTYFIDTKEVWQFSVRDNAVSLDLLCECFGIPSSKDDIKGSEVRKVYYEDNDLPRIVKYCTKDVVALATVYIRMKSMPNKVVCSE
jgi:predicted PolB exonuclease-like 3'-5' exonuclease